jgi:protein-disulfide isomerase
VTRDRAVTGGIALLCVLSGTLTFVLAGAQWRDSRASAGLSSAGGARAVARTIQRNWRDYITTGYEVSTQRPTRAAERQVTIVEFSDFQCPFCQRLALLLDTLAESHPGRFRVIFHNYPLEDIHASAREAALAAVCASRFGHFADFYRVVFGNRAQLGKKPIEWFATRAGIDDSAAFLRCIAETGTADAVDRDMALGRHLDVVGTPTVLIDSVRFDGAPPLATLDSTLRDLMHP